MSRMTCINGIIFSSLSPFLKLIYNLPIMVRSNSHVLAYLIKIIFLVWVNEPAVRW
jgi:hypothetical protein